MRKLTISKSLLGGISQLYKDKGLGQLNLWFRDASHSFVKVIRASYNVRIETLR